MLLIRTFNFRWIKRNLIDHRLYGIFVRRFLTILSLSDGEPAVIIRYSFDDVFAVVAVILTQQVLSTVLWTFCASIKTVILNWSSIIFKDTFRTISTFYFFVILLRNGVDQITFIDVLHDVSTFQASCFNVGCELKLKCRFWSRMSPF